MSLRRNRDFHEIKVDKLPASFHACFTSDSLRAGVTRFFDKLSWNSVVLFFFAQYFNSTYQHTVGVFL